MLIERDVAVPMADGLVLRADVFRPEQGEPVPVILTMGPYGKGLPWRSAHYAASWQRLITLNPEVLEGSSGEYMVWETPDPERWVPAGYAVVRVDSRGAGRSPGVLDIFSPLEARDYYDCIEWAGTQPWSTGKVGLCGISYYAMNQWWVAGLQPPHLAAMIPWEGANDYYREFGRHGGIASNGFITSWYKRQVESVQHSKPGLQDPWLGEAVTGPDELSEAELAANRVDTYGDVLSRRLDDAFYRSRSADFSRIVTPLLSAANWAGFGLHERGNFEGFTESASDQKWLEVHGGRHEEWFYTPYGVALQQRFMDHFLKDVDNGWKQEPRVWLHMRYAAGRRFRLRKEHEWPLARTKWTPVYLDASDGSLSWDPPAASASITFDALGEPLVFRSAPLAEETEITGPMVARLFISSTTTDADLFTTFQAWDEQGREVEFQGTIDPHSPLAQGWLRASHRKLTPARAKPWRPYHAHDEEQPLEPGMVYALDVELWPTGVVLPAGYRVSLVVGGRDFERPPWPGEETSNFRGSGGWTHTDPRDRPPAIFGGRTTVHTGGEHQASLLVPIVPPMSAGGASSSGSPDATAPGHRPG